MLFAFYFLEPDLIILVEFQHYYTSMAHSNEPCWCNKVKIPQELLDLVPESKKQKVCICLKCIQGFKDDQQKLINSY